MKEVAANSGLGQVCKPFTWETGHSGATRRVKGVDDIKEGGRNEKRIKILKLNESQFLC